MAYLLDTNILVRFALSQDPDHVRMFQAVEKLGAANETLYYSSQNLAEFWAVVTRPTTARGGFGLSIKEADEAATLIEASFRHVPDSQASQALWRRWIVEHSVSGVQVYDTRLAAVMNVNGISHILTLNQSDFKRFGVIAVHPKDIVNSTLSIHENL
jgi:predicted nucleic acid-binding protein